MSNKEIKRWFDGVYCPTRVLLEDYLTESMKRLSLLESLSVKYRQLRENIPMGLVLMMSLERDRYRMLERKIRKEKEPLKK